MNAPPNRTGSSLFSGFIRGVNLATTHDGIRLVDTVDGKPINEPHSISQMDLQRVPSDLAPYILASFRARSGATLSCIVVGKIYVRGTVYSGNERANRWYETAPHVKTVASLNKDWGLHAHTSYRFEVGCGAARAIWYAAMEDAQTIQNMREHPLPRDGARGRAFLRWAYDEFSTDAVKDGCSIGNAMVDAVQSEDPKMEMFAYRNFKRFIWDPGQEPAEFARYDPPILGFI